MKQTIILWCVFAPMVLTVPSAHSRDIAGDTVRGAAKRAVIGGIAGDAGKGAAAGAAGSALIGGVRRNR